MSIMVTGGTGSLGQEIVKRLLRVSSSEKIVIYSRDEASQVKMAEQAEFRTPRIEFMVGDVTNRDSLFRVISSKKVEYVIHTAALKHVPIAEKQPSDCIDVNVIGSRNVLQVSAELGVKRVVLVSTDKAANPTNVYGYSKALMEKLMREYDGMNGLTVNVVRFGNLFGSRGSVVELFMKQIKTVGTVTVTDPTMTRFFIKIKQASDSVIFALQHHQSNLIFIPAMKALVLSDLVKSLFAFCEQPQLVTVIGVRPGERHDEDIVSSDELRRSGLVDGFHGFAVHPKELGSNALKQVLNSRDEKKMNEDEITSLLMEIRPTLALV